MKKIIVTLIAVTAVHSVYAQSLTDNTYFKKEKTAIRNILDRQIVAHEQNKGTAVKSRVIAVSNRDNNGLFDSTHYIYSGNRGSQPYLLYANYHNDFYAYNDGSAPIAANLEYVWTRPGTGSLAPAGTYATGYNNLNQVTSITNHRNDYKQYNRYDFFYNAGNQVVRQRIYDTMTSGNAMLLPAEDVYFFYDGQGHGIYDSTYDLVHNRPAYKSYRTFDGAGNNTRLIDYSRNGSIWTVEDTVLNTYNSNNLLAMRVYYNNAGGTLTGWRDSIVYSGSNPLYTYAKEWYLSSGTWYQGNTYNTHINAAGDNWDTLIVQQWNGLVYTPYTKTVGLFNADGTISSSLNYGYTNGVVNPAPGGVYTFYYEQYNAWPTGVAAITAPGKAMIYPNPASTQLSYAGMDDAAFVHISDMQGRLLIRQAVKSSGSIDVATLPSGVYMATFYKEGGSSAGKYTFVKQ